MGAVPISFHTAMQGVEIPAYAGMTGGPLGMTWTIIGAELPRRFLLNLGAQP